MLRFEFPSGMLVNMLDAINGKEKPEERTESLSILLKPCIAVTMYPTSNPHNQVTEEKLRYIDPEARKNNKSRKEVVEKLREEFFYKPVSGPGTS